MTGAPLLCYDGSPDAVEDIRVAGALLPGREPLVLTVSTEENR